MKNGEFVANFVGQQFGPLMHILEKDFPYETNEIEKASLTMEKSKTIRPPRIGEAYAWLECKMEDHLGTWVVGQVLEAEMKDKYAKNVVDLQKAKPLQHIYAEYFTTEMKIRRYKRA
jgi:flavin reductase (DIM6/NTAB) family NADH-FMN oxidoreductase RutF